MRTVDGALDRYEQLEPVGRSGTHCEVVREWVDEERKDSRLAAEEGVDSGVFCVSRFRLFSSLHRVEHCSRAES